MKKINLFYGLLIFAVLSCQEEKSASEKEKPNIIFILSDDHATQAITAYSDRFKDLAPTPNIDQIAKEGAIVRNAFSTNAICGPSRASIITGKYSHINGYYKNYQGGLFNADQWSYPKALQEAGYATALVGKWHLASVPQGFDYFKYHIDHGEQGVYWDPTYSENGVEKKEKGYATNITTDFALNWLNNKPDDKPFCLLLQYKAPHREWSPDEKYVNFLKDDTIPLPPTFYDDYAGRELTAGNTHMTMDFFNRRDMKLSPPDSLEGKSLKKWLDYGNKPNQVVLMNGLENGNELKELKFQRYIKDYLATIQSVDDNIGRVLEYLKDNNLEENTIVIYASDQGFFLGDHGWYDKRMMYEEAIRMPFVVKYPHVIQPNSDIKDIVSNIDIAPTLLEMAGVDVPDEVQGESFFNILKGEKETDSKQSLYYHYYEYPQWHHVQPHYGLRTDRYKLIHFYYDVDQWEFYDLQNDPNELNNLINSDAYASLIEDLKKELYAQKEKYGNTMTLDELRKITDTNFGGLESHKK